MFKLSYKIFDMPNFRSGLTKIAGHNDYKSFKTTYNIARIVKKVDQESALYNDLRVKIVQKYGTENEGKGTYTIPSENKEGFEREIKELHETEFDIERYKLETSEIEGVKLTPVEIQALEPMINILE